MMTDEEVAPIRAVQDGDNLDIYSFGRELIRTNDLDPVYVVVWKAMDAGDLDRLTLEYWLIAYFCFYHVGTASWITEGLKHAPHHYWTRMEEAAGSKEYPRSSERRHFRGENAKRSVAYLRKRGLSDLFDDLTQAGTEARKIIWAVQQWVGFGPWIAFKVADMMERLGIIPVEFNTAVVMYDSPQEAAELLWRVEHPGEGRRAPNKDEGEWAIGRILNDLAPAEFRWNAGIWRGGEPLTDRAHWLAPPTYNRAIGPQEAETILCKFKSYYEGKYKIGHDIKEVRHSLLRFPKCKLSQALYRAGRRSGLWV